MLAICEAVAGVAVGKAGELGMSNEIEVLLRASIAAATSSINAYIGALGGAKKSPVALSHPAAARSRCNRKSGNCGGESCDRSESFTVTSVIEICHALPSA